VEQGYTRAWKTLEENRESLIRLAEALLEYETLDSVEIEAIIKGLPMKPKETASSDVDDGKTAREKEKTTGHSPLPQLMNPKGKPAPA
jgi:hypothetical protein